MFLGMRGTGDWVTNQRPENWRQQILYLYPNGKAPLTAILSMMSSESTDDPHFHWWTELITSVAGSVTGVYTDSLCTSAYVSGGTAGTVLYVTVGATLFGGIRAGHQVLLRYTSDLDLDVVGKVTDKFSSAGAYILAVKILEADDNSSSYTLANCDYLVVIGNINAEGAEMPDAIHLDPTEYYNYCQIFRTPLEITRTARKTKLRTGDAYQKMKSEALEMHSIEMEKAFIWSIRTLGTGSNGKPERTTMGLIPFIRTYSSDNCFNFQTDTDTKYTGQKWDVMGEDWINEKLEVLFRYGSREKLAMCGSGAILGMHKLIKLGGDFALTSDTNVYGLDVTNWKTPFGTIKMITHPLFSEDVTCRNMMTIFEPGNIKYRFIDDTNFYGEGEKQNTGHNRIDGTKEEYLTEAGLEFHHPQTAGIFNGVGIDNAN